tara:strand:+ start:217 stop:477 length:261 start_codon:yes stop_codon:yes gene_type:complete
MAVKTPQKFNSEEIENLKDLQMRISQLTNQFGQLYLGKIKVEEQETFLKDQFSKLEKEETSLAKSLSDKYGKGTLDIETGTFTPTE